MGVCCMRVLRGWALLGMGTTNVSLRLATYVRGGGQNGEWIMVTVLSESELSFPTCSRNSKAGGKP